MPSFLSPVENRNWHARRSNSSAASSGALSARTVASLMNLSDSGGSAAISAASFSAALSTSASATTSLTKPIVSAVCASKVRPLHEIEVRTELADRARQALGAAGARHDADLHLRLAEARRLAGDDDIAMHRQFTAATECEARHGRDQRLREGADRLPGLGGVPAVHLDRIGLRHFDQVGAGGEGLLGAGKHDDAHAVVLGERIEMFGHLAADGDSEWVRDCGRL